MIEDIEGNDKIGGLFGVESIQISDSKKILVRLVYYKNQPYLDIRHWIRFRGRDEFFPTKKGIFMETQFVRRKLIPILQRLAAPE